MNEELKQFVDKTVEFSMHVQSSKPGVFDYVSGVGTMHHVNGGITVQIDQFQYPQPHVTWIDVRPEQVKLLKPNPKGATDFVLLEAR